VTFIQPTTSLFTTQIAGTAVVITVPTLGATASPGSSPATNPFGTSTACSAPANTLPSGPGIYSCGASGCTLLGSAATSSPKPTTPATTGNGTVPARATNSNSTSGPAVYTKTQGSAAVRGVEASFGVIFAAIAVVLAVFAM
jgi:hypothetical protein